jgi:hypothetical protein
MRIGKSHIMKKFALVKHLDEIIYEESIEHTDDNTNEHIYWTLCAM